MTTYYVDLTNGNDSNSGLTTALPKKTVGALSLVSGDYVKVTDGFTSNPAVAVENVTPSATTYVSGTGYYVPAWSSVYWTAANGTMLSKNCGNVTIGGMLLSGAYGQGVSGLFDPLSIRFSYKSGKQETLQNYQSWSVFYPAPNLAAGVKVAYTAVSAAAGYTSVFLPVFNLKTIKNGVKTTPYKVCLCSDTAGATIVADISANLQYAQSNDGQAIGLYYEHPTALPAIGSIAIYTDLATTNVAANTGNDPIIIIDRPYFSYSAAMTLNPASYFFGDYWIPVPKSTAVTAGVIRSASPRNGMAYKCTTAGTTAATHPTYPTTVGATVTHGTSVWTCVKADSLVGLNGAMTTYLNECQPSGAFEREQQTETQIGVTTSSGFDQTYTLYKKRGVSCPFRVSRADAASVSAFGNPDVTIEGGYDKTFVKTDYPTMLSGYLMVDENNVIQFASGIKYKSFLFARYKLPGKSLKNAIFDDVHFLPMRTRNRDYCVSFEDYQDGTALCDDSSVNVKFLGCSFFYGAQMVIPAKSCYVERSTFREAQLSTYEYRQIDAASRASQASIYGTPQKPIILGPNSVIFNSSYAGGTGRLTGAGGRLLINKCKVIITDGGFALNGGAYGFGVATGIGEGSVIYKNSDFQIFGYSLPLLHSTDFGGNVGFVNSNGIANGQIVPKVNQLSAEFQSVYAGGGYSTVDYANVRPGAAAGASSIKITIPVTYSDWYSQYDSGMLMRYRIGSIMCPKKQLTLSAWIRSDDSHFDIYLRVWGANGEIKMIPITPTSLNTWELKSSVITTVRSGVLKVDIAIKIKGAKVASGADAYKNVWIDELKVE